MILSSDLIQVIKSAGEIALAEQKNLTTQVKPDTSIVTNGDLAVSAFLEKELSNLFPDWSIFSEENSKIIPNKNQVIVIDPIDGTESYSRKQDTWSILVGFWKDNCAVAGVVYQPTLNRLYIGEEGEGSYLITPEGGRELLVALAQGELSAFKSPKNYGEHDLLTKLGITNVKDMYSAALKIMEVAHGNVDAYPNFRRACSIWDLVAPWAILKEAGGSLYFQSPPSLDFEKPLWDINFCALGKRIETDPFKSGM